MTSDARYRQRKLMLSCIAGAQVLLALPFLWPWISGPAPDTYPWLATAVFSAIGFAALASAGVERDDAVSAIAGAWLLAALLSSVLALLQWFDVAPATTWIAAAEADRAGANLRQPNHFATLTSLGLAVLLWRASVRPRRWAMLAAILLAMGCVASGSRTGLLQWLLLGLLACAWSVGRRARIRLWLVAAGAYGVSTGIVWVLGPHSALFRLTQGNGCHSRKVLWSNVLELIAQKPLRGWGWGELDYAHYAHLFTGPRFCEFLDNAHNLPLHLAVELGIPLAIAICAGFAMWVWSRRPWAEVDPARQLAWMALAVIGLHSLLEYPLWYGPFQLAVLCCAVLLWRGSAPASWRPAVLAGCAGVLVVCGLIYREYQAVSQSYLSVEKRNPAFRDDPYRAAGGALIFDRQLQFALLVRAGLTPANAAEVHALSGEMLHFSPEPRVIERRIESAVMMGETDDALWHATRYRAAFPQDYARWQERARVALKPAP